MYLQCVCIHFLNQQLHPFDYVEPYLYPTQFGFRQLRDPLASLSLYT